MRREIVWHDEHVRLAKTGRLDPPDRCSCGCGWWGSVEDEGEFTRFELSYTFPWDGGKIYQEHQIHNQNLETIPRLYTIWLDRMVAMIEEAVGKKYTS